MTTPPPSEQAVAVTGFRASGVVCGIKKRQDADLALIVSDQPCSAAAVFTTNLVKAAPVIYDQQLLLQPDATIGAVVINSGNANACTGTQGEADVRATADALAELLGLRPEQVFIMSTGVIGVPLPMERLLSGLPRAVEALDPHGWGDVARAIMTTDTRPKSRTRQVELPSGSRVTIAGVAKGAGMIHPNMATMLSLVVSDAAVERAVLDQALRAAVAKSFNCISIDGDTSTNDTLLLLANGQANNPQIDTLGSPDGAAFLEGLTSLCRDLSMDIVRDGEGANRVATITVRGALSDQDAFHAAMTVATSPLVKTALHGADANWGRVLAALGRSGVYLDPGKVGLDFGGIPVLRGGQPIPFDDAEAHRRLLEPDVLVEADLGLGDGAATVWTCDFSADYVRINADYRS